MHEPSRICSSPARSSVHDGAKVVSSHVGAVADVCGFVHVIARDIIAPASSSGSDKRGRTQPSFSVLHSVL